MTPEDDRELERLIHKTLRDLPPRRAPRSLESRVLAAIAREVALPWWQKGFVHWPVAARVAFFVLSTVLIAGGLQVTAGVNVPAIIGGVAQQFVWIDTISTLASATADFCNAVFRSIPPVWLYGGLAFVAMMYAALFGLGAAAYRTLYARR